jgi:O-methyltransferase
MVTARPHPTERVIARVKPLLKTIGLWAKATQIKRRLTIDPETYFSVFPTYGSTFNEYGPGDPVRYRTIALAITNLQRTNIPGSFAELGVWRGELSRFLHAIAPDRVLYLFDTFEGFPEQDLDVPDYRFKDTSVQVVQEAIGNLDNVRFIKGRFPDTIPQISDGEHFALVMLDMDLYDPTAAALEYFYPRIVPGGYLFAHDYNSPESNYGVQRAVNEFFQEKPESIIELPDPYGTALIRKMRSPSGLPQRWERSS